MLLYLLKKHSYIHKWRWRKKSQNSLSFSYHRVNKIEEFSGWSSVRFVLPFAAYIASYVRKRQILPANYRIVAQSIAYFDTEGRNGLDQRDTLMRGLDHGRRAITYYRCEGWVIASEYRQEIGQKLQATALLTLAGQSPAGQIFIVLLSWLMRGWLPTG